MLQPVLIVCGVVLITAGLARLRAARPLRRDASVRRQSAAVDLLLARAAFAAEVVAARVPLMRRGSDDELRGLCLQAGDTSRSVRILQPLIRASPGALQSRMSGLRLVGLVGGSIAALAVVAISGGLGLILVPPLCTGGALAADVSLRVSARRARARIDDDLPVLLDLLSACTRAGLPLEASLTRVAEHVAPPLAGVLIRAAARQQAGQGPAAALTAEAEAAGSIELIGVAALVERHQRVGLPVAAALDRRAADARSRARAATMARAARAVPLATLVTATVIAPACVLALGAAVVGSILVGGS